MDPTGNARRLRVLVAEDEVTNRLLLTRMLAEVASCDAVVNGKEAVEAVKSARDAGIPYDLLCLDIQMPEMDGHEALRLIRAQEEEAGLQPGEGVKVIMTSALNDPQNVLSSFSEQCEAYLVKPVGKAELLAQIVKLGLLAG